jgi:SulP family sulfate permease
MDEERGFPPYVFHEIVPTQRFLPDDNSGWWGVPYPVISGFMSGIGCIILILQVGPLVGFEAKPEEILANLVAIPEFLTNPLPQATILGLATIAVMYPTPVRVSHTLSS